MLTKLLYFYFIGTLPSSLCRLLHATHSVACRIADFIATLTIQRAAESTLLSFCIRRAFFAEHPLLFDGRTLCNLRLSLQQSDVERTLTVFIYSPGYCIALGDLTICNMTGYWAGYTPNIIHRCSLSTLIHSVCSHSFNQPTVSITRLKLLWSRCTTTSSLG